MLKRNTRNSQNIPDPVIPRIQTPKMVKGAGGRRVITGVSNRASSCVTVHMLPVFVYVAGTVFPPS